MDEVQVFDFAINSRLHYRHNLRLVYYLILVHTSSLSDAARALGVSKTLFHTRILHRNPMFSTAIRPAEGNDGGGRELRLILSPLAQELSPSLFATAERQLGAVDCQQLKEMAKESNRRMLKDRASAVRRLKKIKRISEKYGNDKAYKAELEDQARHLGVDPAELDKEVLSAAPYANTVVQG